jgi:hypothetical protein
MAEVSKTDIGYKSYDPKEIVGVYLTDLGLIMAKVRISNGSYLNVRVGFLKDLIHPDLSELNMNLQDWGFVPVRHKNQK